MNVFDAARKIKEWLDNGQKVTLLRVGCGQSERLDVESADPFHRDDGKYAAHVHASHSIFCYDDEQACCSAEHVAIWVVSASGNNFVDLYTVE